MNDKYYSQFGEDRWLVENVKLPDKGFFVDVGAGEGARMSNTYIFEQKGWEGLCIDGDPRNFYRLSTLRKKVFLGVISTYHGFTKFYLNLAMTDTSRINPQGNEKEVIMPCFTLDEILNLFDVGKIDILSIDIEGSELEVLAKHDFRTESPKIIICEYNISGVLKYDETLNFFAKLGYTLLHETEANFIFQYEK